MESALALSLKAPTWIVKLPLPEMGAPGPLTGFAAGVGRAAGAPWPGAGVGRGTAATETGGAAGAVVPGAGAAGARCGPAPARPPPARGPPLRLPRRRSTFWTPSALAHA